LKVTGLLPVHPETWKRLKSRKAAAPRALRVVPPCGQYAKAYADVYDEKHPAPALMQSLGDLLVDAKIPYAHRLGC